MTRRRTFLMLTALAAGLVPGDYVKPAGSPTKDEVLSDGRWHKLVSTSDGGGDPLRMFVDGHEVHPETGEFKDPDTWERFQEALRNGEVYG